MVYIVIVYLISKKYIFLENNNFLETLLHWSFVVFGLVITIAIMVGDSSHRFLFLNDIKPLFIIIPLILLKFISKSISYNYKLLALASLLILSFTLKTIERHDYFNNRENKAWDNIRLWFPKNTSKTSKVIVAGGSGNFRTLALRSCYGENESSLSWIDPYLQEENAKNFELIRNGYVNDSWDINYKLMLSDKWAAKYILVKGDYHPKTISPIYSLDDYHIFQNNKLE